MYTIRGRMGSIGVNSFNNAIMITSKQRSVTNGLRNPATDAECTKSPGAFCVYGRRNGF